MANDKTCVFCGEKLGLFGSTHISCAGTYQPCCKNCSKEIEPLSEIEQCRRALQSGLAVSPEKLEERIRFMETVPDSRLACLRCGGPMKFLSVRLLDSSPAFDGVLSTSFPVLPAFCEKCGKYEFFEPNTVRADARLAWLIRHDTGE